MTNVTPQQMRELADEVRRELTGVILAAENEYGFDPSHPEQALLDASVAAIRAAADQLEAVRKEAEIWADAPVGELVPCRNVGNLFLAIITADTAPQKVHNRVPVFRDENGRARFGCSLEPITPDTAPQEHTDGGPISGGRIWADHV